MRARQVCFEGWAVEALAEAIAADPALRPWLYPRLVPNLHLDGLARGNVREVSSSVGSWLIAQGYAEPEMRQQSGEENQDLAGIRRPRDMAHDRPHRRSTD